LRSSLPRLEALGPPSASPSWCCLQGHQAPRHVRPLVGIQMHILKLPDPAKGPLDHKVVSINGRIIRQPKLPQRDLEICPLRSEGIQIDGKKKKVGKVV